MKFRIGDKVKIKENTIMGEGVYSGLEGVIVSIVKIGIEVNLSPSSRKIISEKDPFCSFCPFISDFNLRKLNSSNGVTE